MIEIQCNASCDDIMIMSHLKSFDNVDCVEIISKDKDFNESVSVWVNKDQAIQIIEHLKQQFEL